LLERIAIRPAKRSKLRDCPKESASLPATDGEGRIAASEGLEADCPSVRRKLSHALGAKNSPASRLHLLAGQALLPSELLGDRLADGLRGVTPFEDGRQCERQLYAIGPLGVLGIKEPLRALDDERTLTKLLR
jgi:hypothetical protein